LLTALQNFAEAWASGSAGAAGDKKSDPSSDRKKLPQEEIFGVSEFIRMLGAHAENINVLEIEK
jgi:hypothetical protein